MARASQKPLDHEPGIVQRPHVRGKAIYVGESKLCLRGVTYGTFADGGYPERYVVDRDFAAMKANAINAVRVYTVPPLWLLDLAHAHGLFVMVGLPWEQHVTFLADRKRAGAIVERVAAAARACAGHPALLCYVVGNEIPASIVRWHGRRKIERFVRRLSRAVKAEDPECLVTYVNYPSSEYLELPFLDLCCFNVFLERPADYESYLARLQNLAGDRPLLLTEVGLDSRRNGLDAQSNVISWKLGHAFAAGAAGAFVFAWTDEWHRGGHEIDDWDFGLVDRGRRPKPALAAAREAFADAPLPDRSDLPAVSVIICAYNAEGTIEECLAAVEKLEYPNFEVVVVDDGSTDSTAALAREHDVTVLSTENRGLAAARNLGLETSSGEIVAYLDSDAAPDPHWLRYLAAAFERTEHVGIGGPNIAPHDSSWLARCLSRAPGGPIHVLLSDTEAEHIPGCNMAFRRSHLEAVGGFDPRFDAAGDDVDLCWRMLERGWTLGFCPGAVVWHRPRGSLRAYLRQQRGYGKAEAMLERKWPDRYNGSGHVSWGGRVYGNGRGFGRRWRVYYGTWGSGLFQSRHEEAVHPLRMMPSTPEWTLVIAALAAVSALGLLWKPLLPAVLLLAAAAATALVDAAAHAKRISDELVTQAGGSRLRAWAVLTVAHLVQPTARLYGRLRHGLAPWRRHGPRRFAAPLPRVRAVWSEQWRSPESWLQRLEVVIRHLGLPVRRGGPYDRWDLEARGGAFGGTRVRMAVEEHGSARQMLRFRLLPGTGVLTGGTILLVAAVALIAVLSGDWEVALILESTALLAIGLVGWSAGRASATVLAALQELPEPQMVPEEPSETAEAQPDELPPPQELRAPAGVRRFPEEVGAGAVEVAPAVAARLSRVAAGRDERGDLRL